MFAKAAAKNTDRIDGLVGAGTCIAGDIAFSGGLRIDGEVRGNVRTREGQAGTLVIGEQGRIEGNVEAGRVIINGLVTGRVDAKDYLELQAKARVVSDVEYSGLEIHPGAVVQGRLMQRAQAATETLPLAASA